MATAIARNSAPVIRVLCVECLSAHIDVSIDADERPVCEPACKYPRGIRTHEEPIAFFPITE